MKLAIIEITWAWDETEKQTLTHVYKTKQNETKLKNDGKLRQKIRRKKKQWLTTALSRMLRYFLRLQYVLEKCVQIEISTYVVKTINDSSLSCIFF